ncbi:hypothetical protein Fcan01_18410, partial [Folsomia candida]
HGLTNSHLFNPVDCAVNLNVKNLFINNLQIFEFNPQPTHPNTDPDWIWKPLSNFTKLFPNVENFAVKLTVPFKLDVVFGIAEQWKNLEELAVSKKMFRCPEILTALNRMSFVNRIRRLTLDLNSPANGYTERREFDMYERWNDTVLFPSVLAAGSRLQSFKLSGFEKFLEPDPYQSRGINVTHIFLAREAPDLGNVSLAQSNFQELFQTGATVSKRLKITF